MLRTIAFTVGFLAVAYLAVVTLVYFGQRKLLYRPPSDAPSRVGDLSVAPLGPHSSVEVLRLEGSPGAPTVVHFHGNGESVANAAWLGAQLRARGLGFVAVEYPGYGRTPGEPSERSIYRAAEEVLAGLREIGILPERTVLLGQSLGTGVAVEMARRGHASRLVLVSPFTSMAELARVHFPWLPGALMVRDRFDNASKVAEVNVPAYVVHGEQDEVIPFEMGRTLAAHIPGARFEAIRARHNDVWAAGNDALLDRIAAFAWPDGVAASAPSQIAPVR